MFIKQSFRCMIANELAYRMIYKFLSISHTKVQRVINLEYQGSGPVLSSPFRSTSLHITTEVIPTKVRVHDDALLPRS